MMWIKTLDSSHFPSHQFVYTPLSLSVYQFFNYILRFSGSEVNSVMYLGFCRLLSAYCSFYCKNNVWQNGCKLCTGRRWGEEALWRRYYWKKNLLKKGERLREKSWLSLLIVRRICAVTRIKSRFFLSIFCLRGLHK